MELPTQSMDRRFRNSLQLHNLKSLSPKLKQKESIKYCRNILKKSIEFNKSLNVPISTYLNQSINLSEVKETPLR